ncbi:putative Dol-P-Glc:Glc(2)Man(9)GlcNAc(2)-PP-Dol alpha-1,2-glucosyltransferase [Episyrphus balteatus]|uniref:putative Dol-P-Glc:Glc(2)Man(9)GlcNAc(2)-PP-Dol alpha-1,2-glucosyltransferase n=1 Tax=Episyrphus balteatus TaxID=286459 RepID=UPI0024867216|nr:putative Dol-P-Glc:Glc(2)Man(9)GlcNAc(2)-PP-Dol alpha-1,2-glucosyltransferase [Episyrphus balteatus]
MASKSIKHISPLIYLVASIPIFNKLYDTTKSVIDEEFHLRQGLHYCNKRFSEWDPKITTFPGLYIASIIVIPFDMCNVYGLRLVSLLASTCNVYLIFKIRERLTTQQNTIVLALESISISLLPPLYFFSHLYYTDVLSMTFFLSMYYFWSKRSYSLSAMFGALSVLVRQTNIVWVVLFLGICFLDELVEMYAYRRGIKRKSTISLCSPKTLFNIASSWGVVLQSIVNTLKHFYGYIVVVVVFIGFVIANGSIVVGDKSAHEATVHIPQLFYFAVFTLIFGAPVLIENSRQILLTLKRSWKLCAASAILFAIIVGFNTMAHPYLLADNRHYTFYIWNRFYGKYEWFKFIVIPVYVVGLNVIRSSTAHLSSGFQLMFWIACFTALCGQRLLEIRYFLIPFMILRLNLRIWKRKYIVFELIWNLMINCFMFVIFFKKEIYWSNYNEPQRLIW